MDLYVQRNFFITTLKTHKKITTNNRNLTFSQFFKLSKPVEKLRSAHIDKFG